MFPYLYLSHFPKKNSPHLVQPVGRQKNLYKFRCSWLSPSAQNYEAMIIRHILLFSSVPLISIQFMLLQIHIVKL